jgi:surface antigen
MRVKPHSAIGERQTTEPGELDLMRPTLLMIAIGSIGLAGCQSVGSNGAPPIAAVAPAGPAGSTVAPAPAEVPAIPTGAALGGALGGPVGASLTDDDRQAAWQAQIAALDSGKRRSWRGAHGVFGFVEPGATTGDGCRAYSQTIYVAGRPTHGRGVGCKQADGSWKMMS